MKEPVLFRITLPGADGDPSSLDFVDAAGQYVRRVRSVYDSRAHWHRRLYRLTGVTVIVAGSSLPLVTTLTFSHKALVISIVGVSIAALTALRGFYRWDRAWALLRNTEFAITDTYSEWLAVIAAKAGATDEAAALARREATTAMLKNIAEIRRTEAASYFKDLPFPQKD